MAEAKTSKIDVHHHVYPQAMQEGSGLLITQVHLVSGDTNSNLQLLLELVEIHQGGTYPLGASKTTVTSQKQLVIRLPFSQSLRQEPVSRRIPRKPPSYHVNVMSTLVH